MVKIKWQARFEIPNVWQASFKSYVRRCGPNKFLNCAVFSSSPIAVGDSTVRTLDTKHPLKTVNGIKNMTVSFLNSVDPWSKFMLKQKSNSRICVLHTVGCLINPPFHFLAQKEGGGFNKKLRKKSQI